VVGVLALSMVVVGCADVETSDEYQSLLADRDSMSQELVAVEAELAAANDGLAAAQESLAEAEADIARLRGELDVASGRAETAERTTAEAASAAEAVFAASRAEAMWLLWWSEEWYDDLMSIGVPIELADRAIQLIDGPWTTASELAGSPAALDWGDLIEELGDAELDRVWRRWFDAPLESDEELAAAVELQLRLVVTILEEAREASELLSPRPAS
jgi:hypothetical protein